MAGKTLVILTLKKHEKGIWIRRLVNSLEQIVTCDIKVHTVEEWLAEGWIVSSDCLMDVLGIVNRVSDAASPVLFKACCAILGAAQSLGIPIVNGPSSYAMCANKWIHHVLFRQAKLSSPPTMVYFWNSEDTDFIHSEKATRVLREEDTPLLLKPNAGGFGNGIKRLTTPIQNDVSPFDDSMALLQTDMRPRDKKLYRVWFLRGKVQCAIEREIEDEEREFTNACSGSCSRQEPPRAWKIPLNVKDEIENQLLPLLPDAHCGSVEFLYSEKDSERLYFDLNLLSTLPIHVRDTDGIWQKDYDPWMQLATEIWDFVQTWR